MKRVEYLNRLSACLDGHLSSAEIKNAVFYYDELIMEAVEAGRDEEEVIASLGSVEEIVAQIKAEAFFQRAEQKGKMSGYLKAIIAVLGIFAVPIAVPLAIAVIAVIFSLLVALVSIVFSIFAVAFSIGIASIVLVGIGVAMFFSSNIPLGGSLIGAGMILAGITIFAVMLSMKLTQICKILFSKIFKNIYIVLHKKGGAKFE